MAKKATKTNATNNAQELRSKIGAVRDELQQCLLERETAIQLALTALLSGEHYIMLGPPGVAKSLLVREITKRISGASYFEKLMSQTTEPNEIFGPVDLQALSDRGEYRRVSKGALQTAHVAFLDEVFKANSTILNCLLTLTNERLYHEVGYAPQKAPLLTIFGASNETPKEKELAALYDRFPLKSVITDTVEESSFEALVQGSFGSAVHATLSVDDIESARELVNKVAIPEEVVEALKVICRIEAPSQGIRVSDRTVVKAAKIVRAKAWLDGRDEACVEDLVILANLLWQEPEQLKAVERLVYEVANPLHLRAIEVEDQAREVAAQLPSDETWLVAYESAKATTENVIKQLSDMDGSLERELLESKARDKSRAASALYTVRELKKAAAKAMYKQAGRKSAALPGIGG
jgi:MoxR-like ATPase